MGQSTPRRTSSTVGLALLYGVLIVYASLYPFGPWDASAGLTWVERLRLPWPRYWSAFDVWANALGYVPWGFLIGVAVWRRGGGWRWSWLLGVGVPSLIAYGVEVAQYALQPRVPSLADWALNTGGACVGAAWAAVCGRMGWLARWARWREAWFLPGSGGGLVLLALWPLGLVFPPPLPFAEGQFVPELLSVVRGFADESSAWAALALPGVARPSEWAGAWITGLGGLAPCLVLLASSRGGWHRVGLLLLMAGLGVGVSSVSAALNFGPGNAWSWPTAYTAQAVLAAVGGALLLVWLPARIAGVLALPVLTALLILVNGVAPDAYWLGSLAQWEHGRRVHLIGLFQWIGWAWPLLALLWAMARLAPGDQGNP